MISHALTYRTCTAIAIFALGAPVAHAEPAPAQPAPTQPAPTKAKVVNDEDGVPRLSLPTEADRVAWRRPGFRLGLGFAYGELAGLGGAPSGRLIGAKLRAGLRLDEGWSLAASFEY